MGISDQNSHSDRQMRTESSPELAKVVFEFKRDEWHGHGAESMWAIRIREREFALDNTPFFVYGASYRDIVKVKESHGQLVVRKVVRRSGHSTYRVFVTDRSSFEELKSKLEKMGCAFERATEDLYAIDVPPESGIDDVCGVLEQGKLDSVWDFEEGHRADR